MQTIMSTCLLLTDFKVTGFTVKSNCSNNSPLESRAIRLINHKHFRPFGCLRLCSWSHDLFHVLLICYWYDIYHVRLLRHAIKKQQKQSITGKTVVLLWNFLDCMITYFQHKGDIYALFIIYEGLVCKNNHLDLFSQLISFVLSREYHSNWFWGKRGVLCVLKWTLRI